MPRLRQEEDADIKDMTTFHCDQFTNKMILLFWGPSFIQWKFCQNQASHGFYNSTPRHFSRFLDTQVAG